MRPARDGSGSAGVGDGRRPRGGGQPAHADEVDGGVRLPRCRRHRAAGLRGRIVQETPREEEDRLAAAHGSEGLDAALHGAEDHPRAATAAARRGRWPPRAPSAGRTPDAAPAGSRDAELGLDPAIRHAREDVAPGRVVVVVDPEGLVVRHGVEGHRGLGAAALEARQHGQEVLAPLRQPRAPPRIAAGGDEGDLVALADGPLQERGHAAARRHGVALGHPQVVEHEGERAAGAGRARFVAGQHRGHGRPHRRRGFGDEGLEADDLLPLAVLLDDEVLTGETADGMAVAVDHDGVHGDDLHSCGERDGRGLGPCGRGGQHHDHYRERTSTSHARSVSGATRGRPAPPPIGSTMENGRAPDPSRPRPALRRSGRARPEPTGALSVAVSFGFAAHGPRIGGARGGEDGERAQGSVPESEGRRRWTPCFPVTATIRGEEYSVRRSLGILGDKPVHTTVPTADEMKEYRPGSQTPIAGVSLDPCARSRAS